MIELVSRKRPLRTKYMEIMEAMTAMAAMKLVISTPTAHARKDRTRREIREIKVSHERRKASKQLERQSNAMRGRGTYA